jgi:hypothetical protein
MRCYGENYAKVRGLQNEADVQSLNHYVEPQKVCSRVKDGLYRCVVVFFELSRSSAGKQTKPEFGGQKAL